MEVEFEVSGTVERHKVDKPVFYVGRGANMDLRINDSTVSSRHARIVDNPQAPTVEDLGSTNGTRLNDELIREAAFRSGDTLMFGRIAVKVVSVGPSPEASEAGGLTTYAKATDHFRRPEEADDQGLILPLDGDLTGADAGAVLADRRYVGVVRVGPRLATARRFAELMDRLATVVEETLHTTVVSIYVRDETEQRLARVHVRARAGQALPEPDEATLAALDRLVEGRSAVLAAAPAQGEPRALHVPLVAGEKLVGLISAWVTTPMSATDLRLAALIANEAAGILDQTRFLEKLRRTYEDLVKEHDELVADFEKLEAQGRGTPAGAKSGPIAGATSAAVPRPSGEAGRLLDAVIAELRQPVPALQGMIEHGLGELARGAPPAQVSQVLMPTRLALAHLSLIMNDLTELADLEVGRVKLEPVPFDVHAIVGEVHHFEGMAAQQKGVRLGLETIPDPLTVNADAKRIVQMLHHLVVTAVKFTPPGGQVKLSLSASGGRLRFAVEDLAPPDLHAGPGVVIARRLAALMGGDLGIDGEAGRGTEISFSLPLP